MLSRPTLYSFFAVAALLGMTALFLRGSQKLTIPGTAQSLTVGKNILGFMDQTQVEEASGSAFEQFIQSGAQNAKGLASEAIVQAKSVIGESLKKEITRLTEAQVKQLKIQLCTDWGVITSSSSATPSGSQ